MLKVIVHPKKVNIQNPVVLTGFQGTGLVGSIALQYLVKKMNAKQIGYVDTNELPPIALLVDGEIQHPIRIFQCKKKGIILIGTELPIPQKLVYSIASAIVGWSKLNKAKKIICLDGVGSKSSEMSEKPKVFAVINNEKLEKEVKEKTELLRNGVLIGVSAAILLESKERKVKNICYLSEAHNNLPDGYAAAAVINELNKVLKLNVDTKPLIKEAKKFEETLRNVIEKAKAIPKEQEDGKIMYG